MNMIDFVVSTTKKYIDNMPKKLRKRYGQFFTSKETAVFMAELINIPNDKKYVSVLDPGAGTGILTIALIERLQKFSNLKEIHIVCYENDSNILELLHSNLLWVQKQASIKICFQIINDNYILSQASDYSTSQKKTNKYDVVIGNPPYMKIAKNAQEALAMQDVCYGAPNLYFLFATMSLFNLKENGEMVYIIPRSWTSGAYFKRFRQKFLNEGSLEHIHLFVSRNKVFEEEKVLQETIIIKVRKTKIKSPNITITTTHSNSDFTHKTEFIAPYHTVVACNNDMYVYLVTSNNDVEILKKLNTLQNTLPSLGFKMKTGLTVDFRNKSMLRDNAEDKAVPLFYSQHIKDGIVSFPIGKKNEYILPDQKGLLQKNTNYLFVKRFTAKEEHRRLQCGVYIAQKHSQYTEISTQNKINFICGLNELSKCVVYGLYVLFNSKLYDNYYRILNGSTQVNATEVNSMPIPSVDIIKAMGNKLISKKDMSESTCDNILGCYL